MFTVDYYELPDGKKPVEDFIDSLPLKMRTKAFYELALAKKYKADYERRVLKL